MLVSLQPQVTSRQSSHSCLIDDILLQYTNHQKRLSPEVIFSKLYTPQDSGGLKSVFPLLCELPKAIEPHLPVYQLYRWQLGPNKWTSPTTMSLDPIVVTALREGFPWKAADSPLVELPAIFMCQSRDNIPSMYSKNIKN